ncbi:MAG TPA: hypothetical protein VMT63_13290 [Bacteroidales bacterium]|nr:hypothetical protein [Bacteroidales bacterium]
MKSYSLDIAGYNIAIQSAEDGPDLVPAPRFASSICPATASDLLISVHEGHFPLPISATRVFHAPLVEELDGIRSTMDDNFWSVFRSGEDLFIETSLPFSDEGNRTLLKFSLNNLQWDLWIESGSATVDPLEYPLDSLILYYLTTINGDIMIHASGVNHSGKGYIFSGISGTGKSTMAKIWGMSGSRVIHDDRLVIKNISGKYTMFNTPVYENDSPRKSEVNRIFLIGHGQKNRLEPVQGARAVSLVLANCIQHNWNREIIARLVGAVSMMCSSLPVAKLDFKPDREIIDLVLYYE